MNMQQVGVRCYGEWQRGRNMYSYVAQTKTKVFVIQSGITYKELIREITKRFDLGCHPNEVVLNHRMMGNDYWPPCAITDDADVDDLFSTYGHVGGGALLYVTVDRSIACGMTSPIRGATMDLGESSQSRVDLALDNATFPNVESLEMTSFNLRTPIAETQMELCTDSPLCAEDPSGDENDALGNSEDGDEGEAEDDEQVGDEGEADTEPPSTEYVVPPDVNPSNQRLDGTGLKVGDLFASRLHFDEVVIDDALKTGDVYKSVKCSNTERQWRCIVQTCNWRAQCTQKPRCTKLWEVTMYIDFHTCDLVGKST